MLEIPVTTTWPALGKLEVVPAPGELYVGVTQAHATKGYLMNGTERPDLKPTWRSSNPDIATVDRFDGAPFAAPVQRSLPRRNGADE